MVTSRRFSSVVSENPNAASLEFRKQGSGCDSIDTSVYGPKRAIHSAISFTESLKVSQMAAFCSSCGLRTSPGDRFCGACGNSLITLCPTCGQVWEDAPQGSALAYVPPTPTPTFTPPRSEPKREVKVEEAPRKPVEAPVKSNVRLTTAAVDPVYGASYKEKSDCPNCGGKGQRGGTCNICGFSN